MTAPINITTIKISNKHWKNTSINFRTVGLWDSVSGSTILREENVLSSSYDGSYYSLDLSTTAGGYFLCVPGRTYIIAGFRASVNDELQSGSTTMNAVLQNVERLRSTSFSDQSEIIYPTLSSGAGTTPPWIDFDFSSPVGYYDKDIYFRNAYASSVIPHTNGTSYLGNSANRWQGIYANEIYASESSLYLGTEWKLFVDPATSTMKAGHINPQTNTIDNEVPIVNSTPNGGDGSGSGSAKTKVTFQANTSPTLYMDENISITWDGFDEVMCRLEQLMSGAYWTNYNVQYGSVSFPSSQSVTLSTLYNDMLQSSGQFECSGNITNTTKTFYYSWHLSKPSSSGLDAMYFEITKEI